MKQATLACLNFEATHKRFPPATGSINPNNSSIREDWSYIAFTLEFFEEGTLYDAIDKDANWFDDSNMEVVLTPLPGFRCPSRTSTDWVSLFDPGGVSGGFGEQQDSLLRADYWGVMGANTLLDPSLPFFCDKSDAECASVYTMELEQSSGGSRALPGCDCEPAGYAADNGVIVRKKRIPMGKVIDGASHTFLLGESAFGPPETKELNKTRSWIIGSIGDYSYTAKNLTYPINSGLRERSGSGPARNDLGFGSDHPGGCHFSYADGSVHFVSENTSLRVLYVFASRGAGDFTQE